jgi:hypothetical protein
MGTPVATVNGLERVAELLLADADYNAVGVNTDVSVTSNTSLGEETNRTAVATRLQQGATIQVRTLHGNGDMPTVVREIGLFLDASSSPGNGDMLIRVDETFTKSSDDLLVVWEITVS